MPSRCCEFVDSRLRRSPPDRASAVPMDKPGKTRCVSPTLPTGRRLLHKLHSTPQQHGMILISGNGEITSRLYAFSLFFPGSCPNNRDRRTRGARSFDFWLLALSFGVCGLSTNGLINTHLIAYCGDHGIPAVKSATMLAIIGGFSLIGSAASGWLCDRFNPRFLLFWY